MMLDDSDIFELVSRVNPRELSDNALYSVIWWIDDNALWGDLFHAFMNEYNARMGIK